MPINIYIPLHSKTGIKNPDNNGPKIPAKPTVVVIIPKALPFCSSGKLDMIIAKATAEDIAFPMDIKNRAESNNDNSEEKEIVPHPTMKINKPIRWIFFLPTISATHPRGNINAHIVSEEIIITQATDLNVIERSLAILGSDILVTTTSKTNMNKALAATKTTFQRLKDDEYSPVLEVKKKIWGSKIK